jgi:hypothetical protein
MSEPRHVGDGAVDVIWPWHNVDAESCWQRCDRVMLVIELSSHAGDGFPSHASDGVAKVTLAMARCRYQVMLVMVLPR